LTQSCDSATSEMVQPRRIDSNTAERFRSWPSLPAMFFERAAENRERTFVAGKISGEWKHTRYGEATLRVIDLARRLKDLGIQPGDRVLLASENRPEWGLTDLAIMAAGGITVPTYTTYTATDFEYVLSHSGATGIVISNQTLAKKLLPAIKKNNNLRYICTFNLLPRTLTEDLSIPVESWAQAIHEGDRSGWNVLDDPAGYAEDIMQSVQSLKRSDLACIIYTSGTGGKPKGVMLSHGAMLSNCLGAYDLLLDFGLDHERFLSFLPLSHSYEHTTGLLFPISIGAEIYYAESVETLVSNMAEVKPTIITAVPRLYENIHRRIAQNMNRTAGIKRRLFDKALEIGRKRYETPSDLSFADKALDPLLDALVRAKIARRFGGRLKGFVSGGGPLNYDVGLFFNALGVKLLQGYGQTETAPVISCNPPSRVRIETVGEIFPDVACKIADDGEILIKGELTMEGYWGDPEATAEVLKDGWVHTGDIGILDAQGYLTITDRKKDIIVLSGGDNIAPQRVEGVLALQPAIAQSMVIGDKRPHLVALIVPDMDWVKQWCREAQQEVDLTKLRDQEDFKKAVMQAVTTANQDLSSLEKVKRIAIASDAFTIENGMMTPTLKIRRHMIKERFGSQLEALY